MIPLYPELTDISLEMRSTLHPFFTRLEEGISELTFANIYLFRRTYTYRIGMLENDKYVITGEKHGKSFFILPFGLPSDRKTLPDLFARLGYMKLASETIAKVLSEEGYSTEEDRDNFDYIYLREKLAKLDGRILHKKRNLVNAFVNNYSFHGKPIWSGIIPDALKVLELWKSGHDETPTDYAAAKEGLERMEELGLVGSIVYVEGEPAAYTLGEELAAGTGFAIHFEKALEKYKGIYQFTNKCFTSLLPEKYIIINREQDLGDDGLRQAKLSYKPHGFVKKYVITPK
jgi:hypothetical protein